MTQNAISAPIRLLFEGLYSSLVNAVALFWRARIFVKTRIFNQAVSERALRRSGIWDRAFEQKLRAFQKLPGRAIWIHAVSLGEAQTALGLIDLLSERLNLVKFALSSGTETGFAAMSAIGSKHRALALYLPFDLTRLMRPLIEQIAPKIALFVEGDIWLNLLKELSKDEIFTAVVSAKISPLSMRRLHPFRALLPLYWDHLDLICAQSENLKQQLKRLNAPSERLIASGNLKLSNALPQLDRAFSDKLRDQIGCLGDEIFIVLASTHEKEELLLISNLFPLLQKYRRLHLIIAPRHPHRCRALAKALDPLFGAVTLSHLTRSPSNRCARPGPARLHLIEQTGHLTDCYRLAKLAIVGGSFVKGIGGHNVFEPMQAQVPPLFGPHMEGQVELAALALKYRAGVQISHLKLRHQIDQILGDDSELAALRVGCAQAVKGASGSLQATWQALDMRGAFASFEKRVQ